MSKSNPGFHPVEADGGAYRGAAHRYYWAGATWVNVGDVVVLDSNGFANAVPRENDSNQIFLGAVVGVENPTRQDLSASTVSLSGTTTPLVLERKGLRVAGWVMVSDDPGQIYLAEGFTGGLTAANVGQTANVVPNPDPTAANIGRSGHTINITTIGTTATGAVKIVGIPKNIDRYANTAYVKINQHVFSPGSGI